jgi:hypothetical protein
VPAEVSAPDCEYAPAPEYVTFPPEVVVTAPLWVIAAPYTVMFPAMEVFEFPSVTACVGVTPERPTVSVVEVDENETPVMSIAEPKLVAYVGC